MLPALRSCRRGSRRLSGLDSGALAALLKELAKGGLVKRAIEIFDWLRSLDERSDLGCLCDVYTCAFVFAFQPQSAIPAHNMPVFDPALGTLMTRACSCATKSL